MHASLIRPPMELYPGRGAPRTQPTWSMDLVNAIASTSGCRVDPLMPDSPSLS